MKVYHDDGQVALYHGDVRDVLRELPAESVHCAVSSPPYWSLRDYGIAPSVWGGDEGCGHQWAGETRHAERYTGKTKWQHIGEEAQAAGVKVRDVDPNAWGHPTKSDTSTCESCGAWRGALGLEPSPSLYIEHMVEVFREVRRVLRPEGTLWLNMGDSYAANSGPGWQGKNGQRADRRPMTEIRRAPMDGLKPKDLVGVPWMLAFALRQPYYTGTIRDERDRIWLAAMLDAEGCMFIHKRKTGKHNGQGYYRQNDSYGPGVEIANTSAAVVERIMALVGKGSISTQGPDETGGRRKQTIYRWNLRTTECRDFVRELYPHLVAKRHQARILIGCPSSGERAEAAHAALIALHRTGQSDVDFPEPASMFEKGWYLRQDIIWSKANPMPESVTDRCTKAHEYLFLLAKSERYHYDQKAIAESSTDEEYRSVGRIRPSIDPLYVQTGDDGSGRYRTGLNAQLGGRLTRNRRSVWSIPTAPFPEAHFATFAPALVEPCILAGCPEGGTVLDPFVGSGTTAMVARQLGRRAIGIDLNSDYLAMAVRRIGQQGALMVEAAL